LVLNYDIIQVHACPHDQPFKAHDYVMHQQFNIQQLYALPTLYLRENKQRLVPLTAYTNWFS